MSLDWGNVPEWVAGAGAVFALFFAGAAALAARRTLALQGEQIEQLKLDSQRRDEASLQALAVGISVFVRITRTDAGASAHVRYVNTSKLPAYDFAIYLFTPDRLIVRYYEAISPSESRVLGLLSDRLQALYPEDHPGWRDATVRPKVSCSFRDAAGHWWYRGVEGYLCAAKNGDEAATAARNSGPVPPGDPELQTDAPLDSIANPPRPS